MPRDRPPQSQPRVRLSTLSAGRFQREEVEGRAACRPEAAAESLSADRADGKFTELGQWYYDLGSDPQNFATWWFGYFADEKNWPAVSHARLQGNAAAINQGHRIVAWLGTFNKFIQTAPDIDPDVKRSLCSEAWKRSVEKTIRSTINSQGALEHAGNTCAMAQVFHFLRTKFGAMGLRVEYDLHARTLTGSDLHAPDRAVDHQCRKTAISIRPASIIWRRSRQAVGGREADIRSSRTARCSTPAGCLSAGRACQRCTGPGTVCRSSTRCSSTIPIPTRRARKSIFYKWNKLPGGKEADRPQRA